MKNLLNNKKRILTNNKGSAMITALVIGIVISGFVLVTLLVTYTLFAEASRQNWQLQCRNICQTFAENIGSEINDKDSDLHKDIVSVVKGDAENGIAGINQGESKELVYTFEGSGSIDLFTITLTLQCTRKSEDFCYIDAIIKVVRGEENDRDVQSYTLKKSYESVTLAL